MKKYDGGVGVAISSVKYLLKVVYFESARTCSGKVFHMRVVEGI